MTKIDREQQGVVQADSPLFVLAGPGAGKTTTLVERIHANLRREDPKRFLVLTFTRAGVESFEEKLGNVAAALDQHGKQIFDYSRVETFDGFLNGYFVRQILSTFGAGKTFDFIPSYEVDSRGWVALPGGNRKIPLEYFELDGSYRGSSRECREASNDLAFQERIRRLYGELYNDGLVSAKASRTVFSNALEGKNPYVCRELIEDRFRSLALRFPTVYVDEAQDSAPEDYLLVDALERAGASVSYIGDPHQEIYRFRGSIGFDHKKAGRTRCVLTTNYRSTNSICEFLETVYPSGLSSVSRDLVSNNVTVSTFTSAADYSANLRKTRVDEPWAVLSHSQSGLARALGKPQPFGQKPDPVFEFAEIIGASPSKPLEIRNALAATRKLIEYCENGLEIIDHASVIADGLPVIDALCRHIIARLTTGAYGCLRTTNGRADAVSKFARVVGDLTSVIPVVPTIEHYTPSGKVSYPYLQWECGVKNHALPVEYAGTIHSVKGLEFSNVSVVVDSFVPRGQEHLLTILESGNDEPNQVETANVFYVGCSRAKRNLNISFHENGRGGHWLKSQIERLWGSAPFVTVL